MSAWRQDPDGAAAELVRRSACALDLSGRVLVANAGPAARAAVAALGIAADAWSRRAGEVDAPRPWPDGGPFDAVLLRIAKSRDEQAMGLHAALGVLAPGGRILLLGGNEEGIKSAAALLEELCGPSETVSTVAHGRVVRSVRPANVDGLQPALANWRRRISLRVAGVDREWTVYPGLFSGGHLDEGTALMLTALPSLGAKARVLDFGCGTGVIGAAMRARIPGAEIDMLDSDTVALLAAAENVPDARCVLGTGLQATAGARYDAILSNPPLHSGVAEDHRMLTALIADASKVLRRGGLLQLVVQRRVPLGAQLAAHLKSVSIVAENGSFRVWRASTT